MQTFKILSWICFFTLEFSDWIRLPQKWKWLCPQISCLRERKRQVKKGNKEKRFCQQIVVVFFFGGGIGTLWVCLFEKSGGFVDKARKLSVFREKFHMSAVFIMISFCTHYRSMLSHPRLELQLTGSSKLCVSQQRGWEGREKYGH